MRVITEWQLIKIRPQRPERRGYEPDTLSHQSGTMRSPRSAPCGGCGASVTQVNVRQTYCADCRRSGTR
jgi:hypothetical protein